MYRYCGDSQVGKSHENKGTKCQDACHCISKDNMIFASVADGLGSSKHSDVASKIAAQESVIYCANHIQQGMADNQILGVIHAAFDTVNFTIKQRAGDDLDDYDTTLTLAVFIKGDVYYGHAGDSGIIALRADGIFEEVTEAQLGEGHGKERPVYPLASENHWVFKKYPHPTKALFLMTDGMLNKVVPPLLCDQEYQLDNAYLNYLFQNLSDNAELGPWIAGELAQVNPQEVNHDDKTLVGITCNDVKLKRQPKKYYEFPSNELWSSLLAEQKRKLYPYKRENMPPQAESAVISAPMPESVKAKSGGSGAWYIIFVVFGIIIGAVGTIVFTNLFRDDSPPCRNCGYRCDCTEEYPGDEYYQEDDEDEEDDNDYDPIDNGDVVDEYNSDDDLNGYDDDTNENDDDPVSSDDTIGGDDPAGGGTIDGNDPAEGDNTIAGGDPAEGGTIDGDDPAEGDNTINGNDPAGGSTIDGNDPAEGDNTINGDDPGGGGTIDGDDPGGNGYSPDNGYNLDNDNGINPDEDHDNQ